MQAMTERTLDHPTRLQRNLFRAMTATIVTASVLATAWSLGPIFDSITRLAGNMPF